MTAAVPDSVDAVVIGAGHNGLICASYLARAGLRTVLVEARERVGGTAGSEPFAGAMVNICNCDHLTLRTTPVTDELDLARHGLRYLDVDPAQVNVSWSSGGEWALYHDAERTLDELRRTHPDEVDGYRRYLSAARPIAELVLRAAAEPPTRRSLTRLAVARRFAGVPDLMRWSRRSAADILRSFFTHEALRATAAVTGPMVWGISPEFPGSGLGALTHALRHVARVGRPEGGSGALTDAVLASFESGGGHLLTGSAVDRVQCDGARVRGVRLADGSVIEAPVVVSACDPRRTLVEWLHDPPAGAARLIERWRGINAADGYESKIDAIVSSAPRLSGSDRDLGSTTVVAPDLRDIDRAYSMMGAGQVLDRPALLVNVPTLLDPSMGRTDGAQVLSIEALFTPYRVRDGWPGSTEPQRWLEVFATLVEPGFLHTVLDWRAVTPDVYESEFNLPAGHATSFAGGPLAVLRGRDPELTRYETAVPGLYLTGAATFPGAGVWGASGRNCARIVIDRLEEGPPAGMRRHRERLH